MPLLPGGLCHSVPRDSAERSCGGPVFGHRHFCRVSPTGRPLTTGFPVLQSPSPGPLPAPGTRSTVSTAWPGATPAHAGAALMSSDPVTSCNLALGARATLSQCPRPAQQDLWGGWLEEGHCCFLRRWPCCTQASPVAGSHPRGHTSSGATVPYTTSPALVWP